MNTYTTYQPTNIAWLGDIPSHWAIKKLKHIFYEKPHTQNMSINSGSISFGEVVYKDDEKIPEITKRSYQEVLSGEFLINPLNLNYDLISLRIALSQINVVVSAGYIVIKNKLDINKKYYKYLLHIYDVMYMKLLGSGVRSTISFNNIANSLLPIPPLPEQTAIADYLDAKTAQIQTAIRLKREQIDRLKEYRQTLINECITKGLNPNAALKNSGVVWLGDIPSHWTIKKFRHLFSFRKGLSITKENLQETGIPCVNYGEIHSKFGFSVNPQINELKCVSEDYLKNNQKSLLTYGDFIFADTSEDIEGSGNFTYLNSQMLTFAGYHTVICSQKEKHNPRFLAYVFDSSSFRNQIRTKVKGVKVYSITQAILKDNFVWLPPFSEQTAIADYLDSKTTQIDTALATYQAQIDKLNEYQRSLVNDVVTGKIDVRTI